MNFRKICEDFRIPIAPPSHKHSRRGWINVKCPFCTGNPGYHLGFEEHGSGSGFVCYRCGGKGGVRTIAALLHITQENAREIVKNYGGRPYAANDVSKKRDWKVGQSVELPIGSRRLEGQAQKYLTSRNFDPEYLQKMWDIQQTGPVGFFKHRIVIPIKYQGYTISFTCRSYVGSETRYLSCPTDLEAIPHKDILYGIDEVPSRNRVVVIEGCPDTWRFGPGSVATFGTKLTASQLKLLCSFKRVVLFRDLDEAGEAAWALAAARLRFAGSRLDIVSPDGVDDAAELSQDEADYLMKIL